MIRMEGSPDPADLREWSTIESDVTPQNLEV
jgi:hypothetical protein